MILTRTEFLAAFETWFRIAPVQDGTERVDGPLVGQPTLRRSPPRGPPPSPLVSPRLSREAVHFAIGKSSFLARALYGREPLRTVPCPDHHGTWCGVEMPADWPNTNACPHGCELTGWLPAVPQ